MAAEKMTVDSKPMGVHRMDHEDSGAASSPSPERDQNPIAPVELQQPKRKGGRKPVSYYIHIHDIYILGMAN